MSTYAEKLKDPRWQKKRLEILERDGWRCCICTTADRELNVHHDIYGGDPWDVPNRYLQALCVDCHESVEHIKKLLLDRGISTKGWMAKDVIALSVTMSKSINEGLANSPAEFVGMMLKEALGISDSRAHQREVERRLQPIIKLQQNEQRTDPPSADNLAS